MEMNNVITDKMDEKIYSANDTISKEDITHIIDLLFINHSEVSCD